MIETLLIADPTPWFDAETGNLLGAFVGAGIGVIGGTLGAVAGTLSPKGKGRNFVIRGMMTMAGFGFITLVVGVIAVIGGQPYHVWYPMVLLGGMLAGLFGGLTPLICKRYNEAEARRLDADALRRS
ncbi:MAG: hypothetical protein O3A95_02350 [Planctomycetota bacterium]|nr:hypothetical protein [Planctomycetota bacterium]MDA1113125.1 hypothetical protein [Planctomycetota bacterium]